MIYSNGSADRLQPLFSGLAVFATASGTAPCPSHGSMTLARVHLTRDSLLRIDPPLHKEKLGMGKVTHCCYCGLEFANFQNVSRLDAPEAGRRFLWLAWVPEGPDGPNEGPFVDDYDHEKMFIFCSDDCFLNHCGLQDKKLDVVQQWAPYDGFACNVCSRSFGPIGGCWSAALRVKSAIQPEDGAETSAKFDEDEWDNYIRHFVHTCTLECMARAVPFLRASCAADSKCCVQESQS